jgi:hypothetical protein
VNGGRRPAEFTVDGVTDTVKGRAKRLGLSPTGIRDRIRAGATPEEAIRAGGPALGQRRWKKRAPAQRPQRQRPPRRDQLVTIDGITKTRGEWRRILREGGNG